MSNKILNEKERVIMPEVPVKEKEGKIIRELKDKRKENVKYFETENHGGIAAVYPYPVHCEEDGQWKEIDNSLQEDNAEEEGYGNKSSRLKVKFAKHGDSKKLVTLKQGNHKLSWGLEEASSGSGKKEKAEEKEEKKVIFRVYEKMADEQMDEKEWNHPQMKIPDARSGGIYEEILPGVDLEYLLEGETLKENVILKDEEAAKTNFCLRIRHKGLRLKADEQGALCFFAEREKEENAEAVFHLAVPCMYDQSGIYSDGVSYEMKDCGKGETLLTIITDTEWLTDSQRQYPVVIDPGLETVQKTSNIMDTFVREKYPSSSSSHTFGSFTVGNSSSYGKCRAFLKINELPSLPPGVVVYEAKLNVCQYGFSGKDFYVHAHEVTEPWHESSATWNNQPDYQPEVLDYAEIKSVGNGSAWRQFHVTKLVRKWYEGNNLGICLRMKDESISGAADFISSNHPTGNSSGITTKAYPVCSIYYRDAKGLEDYYSYHDQSVGRAGNVYVNDYNGNLVLVHPDAATAGTSFPASLAHVYNASDKNNDNRLGYGWRLSAWKELRSSGIENYPYVYIDEDGTNHYFYKDTSDNNKLKDEDGLGLVITQTSSSNDNAYMVMETKDKIKMTFRKDGFISTEADPNGNTVTYFYESDSKGTYLSKIKDPLDFYLKLTYQDGKLSMVKDEMNRATVFRYEGENLKSITYPDGKQSRYGYGVGDESHLLKYVKAPDEYEVDYDYGDYYGVKRVNHIVERKGSQIGQELRIDYKTGNRTVFEEPGLDGVLKTPSGSSTDYEKDNHVYTYQFDDSGRAVCVCDKDGNAASYGYFKEGQKNHKLSSAGSTMKPIQNYLMNTRFEKEMAYWNKNLAGNGQITAASGNGYIGDRSAKIVRRLVEYSETGISQSLQIGSTLPVSPGETCTLSAWVKITDIDQGEVILRAEGLKSSGAAVALGTSQGISEVTDTKIDNGWQRESLTFTVPSGCETLQVSAVLSHGTGTCYMTCFQLEKGAVANPFNLLENGNFERGDSSNGYLPESFEGILTNISAGADGRNSNYKKEGTYSFCIKGEPDKRKGLWKRIPIKGSENDVFSVSGWAKGTGIPEKEFGITVGFEYEDKTVKWENIPFNPYVTDWQFVSKAITPNDQIADTSQKYQALLFHIFYGCNANEAYFDNFQIIRDDGESYVYDDDGNLISAKSAAERSGAAHDKHGNLSKMTDMTGTSFEYGYDEKQNLKRAASSEQVVYQFAYDEKGNPIKTQAYGEFRRGAVIPGRTYYIREKVSGKYLEIPAGSNAAGTATQLNSFQASNNQKWNLVDAGGGYFILQSMHAPGMVLDVAGGSDKDNVKLDIAARDNKKDAQKFKLISHWRGEYQIAAKCSKDKRVLTNAADSTSDGAAVTIWGANDSYHRQKWYFELADLTTVSDAPEDGSIFAIRARHSGQYLDVPGGASTSGTGLQQYYYNGSDGQSFFLQKADNSGNYYLKPVCAPDMVLTRIANDTSINRPAVILRPFSSGNTAQKFQFKQVGSSYAIWNSNSNEGMGIMGNSWGSGARVVTDGSQALNSYSPNKLFVLENRGKCIESSMTYTSDGRHVKSVTDARGKTTTNSYDTYQRMLSSVTDAKGNRTEYSYNLNTDQLTRVSAKVGETTIANTYTYDNADRLSSIGHNGFSYNFEYDAFGNPTKVKVGNTALETYEYLPHNGPQKSVSYANGGMAKNEYDKDFRLISQKYVDESGKESTLFENTYDAYDNIIIHKDIPRQETYQYQYDLIGRMTAMERRDAKNHTILQNLRVSYDDKNRVESVVSKINGSTKTTGYRYGNSSGGERPGLIYGMYVDGLRKSILSYDKMSRLTEKAISLDSGYYRTSYTYGPGVKDWQTTTLPGSIRNGNHTLKYTYDNLENIETILENGTEKVSYTYDALSRLIREDNKWLNKTICYSYDAGGNITAKKEYAYTKGTLGAVKKTISYTYGNSAWKDQLTSYNGQAITYDAMGNPLTYRDGMDMQWIEGKKLYFLGDRNKGLLYAFTYNSNGQRVRKDVVRGHDVINQVEYYWNGDEMVALQDGSDLMHFTYDQEGNPFSVTWKGKDYYYLYNLQKDIIGLIDSSGAQVVSYQYDTWGKLISTTDSTSMGIGKQNPFRYRGYCYDEETGLYYLESRYYDPETGRFINADEVEALDENTESLEGYNLYSYCNNNPVNMIDDDGHLPKWAKHLIIGTAVIATAAVLTVATAGTGTALACFAAGALKGAAIGAATGAVQGAVEGAVSNRIRSGSWKNTGKAILKGAAKGYMSGAIVGFVTGGLSSSVCFIAGTVISTEYGKKVIECIREGELVWAQDENTGEKTLKKVLHTFINETYELVHVQIQGEIISSTPGHPYYIAGKGWVCAQSLKPGDRVFFKNGCMEEIQSVEIERTEKPVKVYNFEVEDFHTYFVGENEVLVHNLCRQTAVKRAWKNEREMVAKTGRGSRNWNSKQKIELLQKGKVKGYYGHHKFSVHGHQELKGDWRNIQFLTRKEHLRAHNHNWRTQTKWKYRPGTRYQAHFK